MILPTPAYMPFLTVPPPGPRDHPGPDGHGGGRPVLDLDGIDAAFRRGGHLLILCNPCNPIGRVYAQAELAGVGEVVERHGGRVFADEIHAPLVYPGRQHIPYASLSEVTAGHTLTGTSASKGWNLPGLKCAQLILCNEADRDLGGGGPGYRARRVHPRRARQHRGVHRGPGLARGGAGLPGPEPRAARGPARRAPPRVRYQPPEGTYLAWLDCRELGLGDSPGEFFLDKGSVLVNDGPAFGEAGKGHVRLNFATPRPILQAIVRQMGEAVAGH